MSDISVARQPIFDKDLGVLVGNRRAWIKVSEAFLYDALSLQLPAERLILEVKDGPMERIAALKERGYAIALDDFEYQPELDGSSTWPTSSSSTPTGSGSRTPCWTLQWTWFSRPCHCRMRSRTRCTATKYLKACRLRRSTRSPSRRPGKQGWKSRRRPPSP
jgi:hypothetical protein